MNVDALALAAEAHGAALGLMCLQTLAGARLLSLARLDGCLGWTPERLLFGWLAGFSLSSALWMALAGSGHLGPGSVLAVAAGLAVLGAPALARLRGLRPDRRWLFAALGGAALLLWATPLLVETLLPNSDWDSALYQLPLAEHYLGGSLFGRDAAFPALSFPGAVNLQYAALLALHLEPAVTPLNFWTVIATGAVVACSAARLRGRAAALWAVAVFASTHLFFQLGVDARVDGFLAAFCALAFHALVLSRLDGTDDRPLLLMALALGAAIGTKYTGALVAVGLGATALLLRLRQTPRPRAAVAAAALALALVPNGAWYVANAALHGDPLFPMLRGNYTLDADGAAVHVARGEDEAAAASLLLDPAVRARYEELETPRTPRPKHLLNLFDVLRHPERYSVKPNHFASPLLFVSLLLPLALPASRERRRAALLLFFCAWSGYALLGASTNVLRYELPVLPELAVLSGVLFAGVPSRAVRAGLAVLVVALLARNAAAEWQRLALLDPRDALTPPLAWEPAQRVRWLAEVGYNHTLSMPVFMRWWNEQAARGAVSRDAKIFMVGEGKGRLLDAESIPDATWFGHRMVSLLRQVGGDPAALTRALRASGVTHVLYNRAYYDWVVAETSTARARVAFLSVQMDRWIDWLQAHGGKLVFRSAGIELYRLPEDAR